jgi:DNA-binding CsgD family transcriptional regulator
MEEAMLDSEIKQHVMVKYGKRFGELCASIFRSTPVNYIGLARIYNNGSRSYLISDPAWGEVLLEKKYHLAGTEDALIHGPESSFQLWSASAMFAVTQKTQELLKDCIANNYGNGVTLIERGKNFIEFIHICANSGYERVDNYLINNIDSLWKSVLSIRENLAKDKALKNAYDKKYHYNVLLPEPVLGTAKIGLKKPTKKYFLGGYFDNIYFTPKEMDCLTLLYENQTIQQIAKRLDLSPRTVESYINNIKQKTSCFNKTALVLELSRNNLFKNFINKIK